MINNQSTEIIIINQLLTSSHQIGERFTGLSTVILAVRLLSAVPTVASVIGHLQVGVVETHLGRSCKWLCKNEYWC